MVTQVVSIENFKLLVGQSTSFIKNLLKHLGDWRKLSSSEYSLNYSCRVYMGNGGVSFNYKRDDYFVRPFSAVGPEQI